MYRAPRLAALALSAFPALVAVAPLAHAQSPATPSRAARDRPSARVRDALTGDALTAFDRAALLFTSRNFGPARAEFERAHELSGEPRVLYDVAVCDKELGRYGRAIRALEQSLSEGGGELPPGYVGAVRDTIALLAPLVTVLALQSDPPGASVLVDGEPSGTTPLGESISLDVGEHDLVVRKTGYVDFSRHITALGGHPVKVQAALEPLLKHGELVVTASGGKPSAPPDVLVDGTDVGSAPWRGNVEAGVHIVSVRAGGYSAPERRVEVPSGEKTALGFALAPDGRLRISVDDTSAMIKLDGDVLARGSFDGPVTSGEHEIVVTRADGGGTPYKTEIALDRGETRSMSIQIHRGIEVPGWVWIGGGSLIAAAGITAAVLALTATTKYQGSAPGTLPPTTVKTSGFQVTAW